MNWRVFVHLKPQFADHRGEALRKEWKHAGFGELKKVRAGQAYEISGDVSDVELRRLAEKLLTDPITQEATLFPADETAAPAGAHLAQVWPKPGVSDPVAETVKLGARDLDCRGVSAVRAGALYEFWGKARAKDVQAFCEDYLMNPLVQKVDLL